MATKYTSAFNIVLEIAKQLLDDRLAGHFGFTPDDLKDTRNYLQERYPFGKIALEQGKKFGNTRAIKKKIVAQVKDILKGCIALIEENSWLKKEIKTLTKENQLLSQQVQHYKQLTEKVMDIHYPEHGVAYDSDVFHPAYRLEVNPKLTAFIRNHQIAFVNREECLVKMKLKNVRYLGQDSIKEIRKSLP